MAVLEETLPEVGPPAAPVVVPAIPDAPGIRLADTLRIALDNLLANKGRTVLTALGVIIGVAAVVALLAVGRGTQEQIAAQITANGANLLTIRSQGAAGGGNTRLTVDDAQALADPANVPAATLVSPESMNIAKVVAGSVNNTTLVLGVTPAYATIHNEKLSAGAFFDSSQTDAPVAVLGAREAETLFPDGNAVGQSIRLNGQSFRVVGMLAAKGRGALSFDDDAVLIPLGVAGRKLFGERVAGAGGKAAVESIVVQARDAAGVDRTRAEIAAVLRERHRLPMTGDADDFTIDNQQDLIDTLTASSRTMTFYLAAIAAISLLVGGIGIMNIMLVSVRERTREIGLRKAIGARERDILAQFLIEALSLSTVGGLIGLLIGITIAVGANNTGQTPAVVSPESALLAVGFALAVGLFFGIEPARRAARLDPIEALRYE
jgi:putative ABC transport system permease protein